MDAVALHSGEYVERFKSFPVSRIRRLVERMAVAPTDKVVDFGCGTGLLLHCLPPFGSYDGVDFSADFIEAAKGRAGDRKCARFHCRDIVDFCAEHRDAFDVAATLDFSEHIDDDTFETLYRAIFSSLRPDGRLYLHTPNLAFFLERLKHRGVLRQFPEHIAVRDAEQNTNLLRKCGFERITVEAIPHYNVLKVVHPLRRLPLLGRLFEARLWITARRCG